VSELPELNRPSAAPLVPATSTPQRRWIGLLGLVMIILLIVLGTKVGLDRAKSSAPPSTPFSSH
jgi:hypothetical protein